VPVAGPAGPRTRDFPHLTTLTLEAILRGCGVDFTTYPAESIWSGNNHAPTGDFDLMLISTTFIWERRGLARALTWARDRYPTATVILGGQYSNLKYRQILTAEPSVRFIVRGDGEAALPPLLRALDGRGDIDDVPNLAWRNTDTGEIRHTHLAYVDLDAEPSPQVDGAAAVIPYESMRGCPFHCKFCSFPAASPQWRYKSATKIADDFARYHHHNGAQLIKALDSTFTVLPRRLRELLPLLAGVGVRWEAYTRANAISDQRTVQALETAHCAALAIGFESMNETVLGYMNKKVTAKANRAAFRLLRNSEIDYRASFMVGYPGETPEQFHDTRRFLTEEYTGRFSLYVFSLSDDTMPVWQDAQRFQLTIADSDAPDQAWQHIGMDHLTAQDLQRETLKDVRWNNDHALLNLWQGDYEIPLAPTHTETENLHIEKLVERLGMLPADFPNEPPAANTKQRSPRHFADTELSPTAAATNQPNPPPTSDALLLM
jgi:anaerobic magnesium-protoporphyrin IX monomethyl ester cyclase